MGTRLTILIEKTSLDTVEKPICAPHCERQIEWQTLLNTPGGSFNKGLSYAFNIHHQKAAPVDEPITLQWNLNQTKQREVSTL
jgi:hypothetical protein